MTHNPIAGTPTVRVPLSKSIAARLGVIAFLAGEDVDSLFDGRQPLCEDLQVMHTALGALAGYRCKAAQGHKPEPVDIDLRDSGTARHLLTALCACTPGIKATLHISQGLAARPFSVLPRMLGILSSCRLDTKDSRCIKILGGGFFGCDLCFKLDTSRSSQPCTALMLIAPYGRYAVSFTISPATVSSPYIDMTARLMQACGAAVKYDKAACKISVKPSPYRTPSPALLEGDWSAAPFFYLHALLSGREVVVKGLCAPAGSLQGDAAVAGIFEKLGVDTLPEAGGSLRLRPGGESVRKLDMIMRGTPDLVPAVAVACAMKGIPFALCGISHLRYKESDRLQALKEALGCFGLKVDVGVDSLEYDGQTALHAPAGVLPVFGDHRMAMALAQTAVCLPGVQLDDTECVKKSFPDFWKQMERLGVRRR